MSSSSSNVEIKYDITPYDCTPGKPWEAFDNRFLNKGTRALTTAGTELYSLSDHFLGTDEGGPNGPAHPGGADGRKSQAAHRKRQKDSYELFLTRHSYELFLTRHLVGAWWIVVRAP